MATISLITTFSLNTTPKKFIFADTTDWAGQGISTSDVNGCVKITSPSGFIIYDNTNFANADCDIWVDNSLTSQQTISLPYLNNGSPEQGEYTVVYSVYNSATLETYTQEYTYDFNYTKPKAKITYQVDCYAPNLVATDNTNYLVNTVEPTQDKTLTLQFPFTDNGSPVASPIVNTTSNTIVTRTFYNGMQVFTIENDLSWTFDDGLVVVDTVEGTKQITVDCTYICDIVCCIRAWRDKTQQAYDNGNTTLYRQYMNVYQQMLNEKTALDTFVQCGKQESANDCIVRIKELGQCTDDCACVDGEPSLVVGLGGINATSITEVDSAGTPIEVTSDTVGNTTTYHVGIEQSFIDLVLAGSSNITIANTVFVAKNGSDSTGLAERLDKPFLTIAAAITAAVALTPSATKRIRVVVFAGDYDELIDIKDFVDIELNNANVVYTGGSHMIRDLSVKADVKIYGVGTLQKTVAASNFIQIGGNGTILTIDVKSMSSANASFSTSGGIYTLANTTLTINCPSVSVAYIDISGTATINGNVAAYSGARANGGTLTINGNLTTTGANHTLEVTTSGTAYLKNSYCTGANNSYYPIKVTSGTIEVNSCDIRQTGNSIAIYVTSGQTLRFKGDNMITTYPLIFGGRPPLSMTSNAATNVRNYGKLVTNAAIQNITLLIGTRANYGWILDPNA